MTTSLVFGSELDSRGVELDMTNARLQAGSGIILEPQRTRFTPIDRKVELLSNLAARFTNSRLLFRHCQPSCGKRKRPLQSRLNSTTVSNGYGFDTRFKLPVRTTRRLRVHIRSLPTAQNTRNFRTI